MTSLPVTDYAISPARKPLRVALYARVSTDHQTTTNQLRELQEVAERHRWNVTGEYFDRGQSGATEPHRKEECKCKCKCAPAL